MIRCIGSRNLLKLKPHLKQQQQKTNNYVWGWLSGILHLGLLFWVSAQSLSLELHHQRPVGASVSPTRRKNHTEECLLICIFWELLRPMRGTYLHVTLSSPPTKPKKIGSIFHISSLMILGPL